MKESYTASIMHIGNYFNKIKEYFKKDGFLVKTLFCVILAIYFSFGFYHLGNFISADEHFWLPNSGQERIQNYWNAIKDGKWENTRINDKPGVTLAYTSGIALLFEKDLESQIIKGKGTTRIYNPQKTREINFAFRLPVLLLSGFMSLLFFWLIKKITDSEWIALFSIAGIYLSPILIGMSQIVNPDSLFWLFGFATLLSFFAFVQKGERKFALLSGVMLGLSLASKYVSVIFFPFFFVMMLGYYLFAYSSFEDPKKFNAAIVRYGLWYVGVLALGMLIFAILMPASFVEPKFFYEGTIGFPGMSSIFWMIMIANALLILASWKLPKINTWIFGKMQPLAKYLPKIIYAVLIGTFVFVVVNWLTRHSILDLSNIPFDAKRKDSFSELPFYKKYLMEFVAFVFSMTPVTLFALLFVWIRSFFVKSKHDFLLFILSVFFLVFYAAVVMQGLLVTTRYSIILYPLAMIMGAVALVDTFNSKQQKKEASLAFLWLLCGIGFLWIFSFLQQSSFIFLRGKIDYYASNLAISVPITVAFLAFSFFALKKYFPFAILQKISIYAVFAIFVLMNVFSVLLMKPFYFSYTNELLPKRYIISGAWGYGGYEAAQYLNSLPGAENLTLWADVYGVCEFFKGKCIHKAKVDVVKNPIDYYFQSLQSTIGMNFPHPMEKKEIWRMEIDGRGKSFLKIRKAKPLTNVPNNMEENSDDTIEN